MGKVLSFEPRVGKVKTGLTSGGFTVIVPLKLKDLTKYWLIGADMH